MDTTTNFALNKPIYGELASIWTAGLNTNADTIDTYLAMIPIVHFGSVQIGMATNIGNTILTPVVY
jgi:hypothetical protein